MNARTIRRAQERKALKAARKESLQATPSPEAAPQTDTAKRSLLSSADAALYQVHVNRFFADWNPATGRETELVQSLADTQWRLNRIPDLELGIYALARLECSHDFKDHTPEAIEVLIKAQAFISYQKQLNSLSTQEVRLRRQYQSDRKELADLIGERQSRDSQQIGITGPPALALSAETPTPPAASHHDDAEFGFEFSNPFSNGTRENEHCCLKSAEDLESALFSSDGLRPVG